MDYVNFKQSHKYHNCFDLNERDLRTIKLTDKFKIHFLELPKIELDIGKNRLLDWLIFFKYCNDEEVMKDLLEANKVIRAAVDELDKIRNDPEARRQYEAARK